MQSATDLLVSNVEEALNQLDYVFIPPSVDAINKIIAAGMPINLIYPATTSLDSQVEAMRKKGDDEEAIQIVRSFWDQYQETYENYTHPVNLLKKIRLPANRGLDQVWNLVKPHLLSVK